VDPTVKIGHARRFAWAPKTALGPISLLGRRFWPANGTARGDRCGDEAARHALAIGRLGVVHSKGILFISAATQSMDWRCSARHVRASRDLVSPTLFMAEILRGAGWQKALAGAGEVDEGLATIDEARCSDRAHEERWCIARIIAHQRRILLWTG